MKSACASAFVESSCARRIAAVGAVLFAMSLGAVTLGAQSTNFGSVPVNSSTAVTMTVPLTPVSGGTVATVSVVTQGAPNLDFTDAGTGTCAAGNSLNAGGTCTVVVNFTPRVSGTRYGGVTLFDNAGDVLANAYLQGTGVGPQVVFNPSAQSTVGNGMSFDFAVAVDSSGNIYISDGGNHRVLKETLSGGAYTQSTIATDLGFPRGVAVDGSGNVYFTDLLINRVVKETLSGGAYTESTIATGLYFGGVAVDGSGNVFVADTYGGRVLELTLSGGNYTLSTVVSGLSQPFGLAVDGNGNVYIPDCNNSRVLKETLSGGAYTQSTIGTVSYPGGVAVDGNGNVYIADSDNGRILKETPSGGSYTQSIIASNINYPDGVAVDGSGNVYFTEYSNSRLHEYETGVPPSVSFANTIDGATSSDSPQTVTVENNGNQPLDLSAVNYPVDFPEAAGVSTDCNPSTQLAAGGTCTLSIDFAPLSSSLIGASTLLNESVLLADNSLNQSGTQQFVLVNSTELPQAATILSPASGSILPSSLVLFSWTAGSQVTSYRLQVGTAGAGSSNIYSGGAVTSLNKWVSGIPTTGGTLYVRLHSMIGGVWQYLDFTYAEAVAAAPATMTSPTPGSTLTGSTVLFSWTAGSQATQYDLHVGTTGPGSVNIYWGIVSGLSQTISGIPTTSGTLYVRLYSFINGQWQYNDYTYTEATPAPAAITSPTPGSTITSSTVVFSWTAGSQVNQYELAVGTTGVGSSNVFQGIGTGQEMSVTGITLNGGTLFVRLYSYINGARQYNDYTYAESGAAAPATLISPTPGSTLTSSTVLFTWTAGSQVTQYDLHVGTTGVGSSNIFGGVVSGQSTTVTGIPTAGGTFYVRLYSLINGAWQYIDYTYTEFIVPAPATMMSPTPSSTLTGSTVTFSWTAGTQVKQYDLHVGTTGAGSSNVFGGVVSGQSTIVTGIPTSGGTLYVRLYSLIAGAWQYVDYTYTEQ